MKDKVKTFGDLCDEIYYEEIKNNAMGLAAGVVGLGFDFCKYAIDKIDDIDILGDIKKIVVKLNTPLEKIDYKKDNKPLTVNLKK